MRTNRPMMKIRKGDCNDTARQNRDHMVAGGESTKFDKGFDGIKWRSKSGLPPKSGKRCRIVKHAEANLPVYGNP